MNIELSYDINIIQCDGNITIESLDTSNISVNKPSPSLSEPGMKIPIVVNIHTHTERVPPPPWYEPHHSHSDRSENKPTLKTIYRNNRISQCVNLPVVSVSNLRSLWPKVRAYCADLAEREISLSILSEVWQRTGNKKHNSHIEKMLQIGGLKYISTPRPSYKRVGG